MSPKLKFVIISALYFLCIHNSNVNGFCHLDHMKRYALNSCEMLIDALKDNYPNPHNERLKRELLEPHNSTMNFYVESRHIRPTHLRVRDRSFPAGGSIVLDHLYAKVLRQSYPSTYHYMPRALFQRYEDNMNQNHHHKHSDDNEMDNEVPRRRKRNHQMGDSKEKKTINVTYCCMNNCKPYDLCEL